LIPKTRGECVNGPRPCPHKTCKYHLGFKGSDTCTLDVTDRNEPHGATTEEIAKAMGVSRPAVSKLIKHALGKQPMLKHLEDNG
jgi:hypothetical protein